MKLLNKPFLSLFLVASSLVSAIAVAQEARWYRVELLVFSQGSQAAQLSEAWEPTPTLLYPDEGRFLVNTQSAADKRREYDAIGKIDALGYQTINVKPPSGRGSAAQAQPTGNSAKPASPTHPTPFVLLPHSELEFRGKAAYMARTGRYHTLFHETWVQPMRSASQAVPIIIDHSGDTQRWPELQGSVKLYLTRYLHLETNLWLNTDGSYLKEQWQMPAPPLGPSSVIIVYPPGFEPEPNTKLPEVEEAPAINSMMAEQDGELMEPVVQGPVYPWRHAVLLQQERRMRSTEVHYIDHPMLGVVIKISPVSKAELLDRAEAEARATAKTPP